MANKNWTWDDHKYKSREWVKGKWQYTYNTIKNAANKVKETAEEASSKVSNLKNNSKENFQKSKEYISDKISNSKDDIQNKIEQNSKQLDKIRNETDKKVKEQYNKLFNLTPKEVLSNSDKESIITETIQNRYTLTPSQTEATNNRIRDVVVEDEIQYWQADNFLRDLNDNWDGIPSIVSIITGTWPAYLLGMYLIDKHNEPINEEERRKAIEESYESNRSKVDDKIEEEIQKLIEEDRQRAEEERKAYERRKRRTEALKDIESFLDNLPFDYDKVSYRIGGQTREYDLRTLIEDAFLDQNDTYAVEPIQNRNEIQEQVNPNYDPNDSDINYEINCASCSLTFDLLNRGYSSADAKHLNGGATDETILSWYKDPKIVDFTNITAKHKSYSEQDIYNIEDTLATIYPEGSYGHVGVSWNPQLGYGGGHSMIFEIIDGEVVIRDTQSNDIYYSNRSSKYTPPTYNFWTGEQVGGDTYSVESLLMLTAQLYVFRSDNLELNTTNINKFYLDDDNPWRPI